MSFSNLETAYVVQPALSKNVVDVLREMISQGQLKQGSHLKEAEIASALGVSRGPVREALNLLANEGYVELRRHRGAFVVELTRNDIIELYTLRLALERLAIERAVTRMTPERFAAMDKVLAQMQAVTNDYTVPQVVKLDLRFHDLLYEAAEHGRLTRSWELIRSQVEFFLNARNLSHRDFLQVGYAEHAELREILATGNPELASEAIRKHLDGAYSRLLATHPEEDHEGNHDDRDSG